MVRGRVGEKGGGGGEGSIRILNYEYQELLNRATASKLFVQGFCFFSFCCFFGQVVILPPFVPMSCY